MTGRPYTDRRDAGRQLAQLLERFRGMPDIVVLGLPRGGVPVADEVAKALEAPLDVLVVRKIGVPSQPEVAMGAIAFVAGALKTVKNQDVIDQLRHMGWDEAVFDEIAANEERELHHREESFRAGRPILDVAGKIVILVDDGLATGATMRAAIAATRSAEPKRVVVAVPVGLAGAVTDIRENVDELVCAWAPLEFLAVGQAYRNFDQTTDDEVHQILRDAQSRLT